MKSKKTSLSFVIVLGIFLVCIAIPLIPVKADVGWVYKYMDDAASYDDWTQTGGGGKASARGDGDMNDIGVKCSTGGIFQWAKAKSFFDGSINDNSPWTFSTSRTYYVYFQWYISGCYEDDTKNSLKFYYKLFYMSGSTKVYVFEKTYEYTSDFDKENDYEAHAMGSVYLYSSKTYYLEGYVYLYHSWTHAASDMYSGANKLNFYRVGFLYYF